MLSGVPGLVGEVAFLAWGDVDVRALREGMGAQPCGPGRAIVDTHALHGYTRQTFDAGTKASGQFVSADAGRRQGQLREACFGEGSARLDGFAALD